MRRTRIYCPGDYKVDDVLTLPPEAGHHVGVVLRMRAGELVTLFNGNYQEYQAIIHAIKKNQVTVLIQSEQHVSKESSLSIHLAHALSKGERMEWVMQKAVELGVHSITPLITERSVVKLDKERMIKKVQQWQAIVISACEQSGRTCIPKVQYPQQFADFTHNDPGKTKFILNPSSKKTWRDYPQVHNHITVVIGPEGGLTADEIATATSNQFHSLTLGPRILRTETAALSIVSVLQALYGDL